jgi:hypothetical protein
MSIVPVDIITGIGVGARLGTAVGGRVTVGAGRGVGAANAGALHASKKTMHIAATTKVCFLSIGISFLHPKQELVSDITDQADGAGKVVGRRPAPGAQFATRDAIINQ